jgi:hypothetical protein
VAPNPSSTGKGRLIPFHQVPLTRTLILKRSACCVRVIIPVAYLPSKRRYRKLASMSGHATYRDLVRLW